MPEDLPDREAIIAAIEARYATETDPLIEAVRRGAGEKADTSEKDNLIAGINKAFGYDPDAEGLHEDDTATLRAFKRGIDRAMDR